MFAAGDMCGAGEGLFVRRCGSVNAKRGLSTRRLRGNFEGKNKIPTLVSPLTPSPTAQSVGGRERMWRGRGGTRSESVLFTVSRRKEGGGFAVDLRQSVNNLPL